MKTGLATNIDGPPGIITDCCNIDEESSLVGVLPRFLLFPGKSSVVFLLEKLQKRPIFNCLYMLQGSRLLLEPKLKFHS